jgi:hypothetical protein
LNDDALKDLFLEQNFAAASAAAAERSLLENPSVSDEREEASEKAQTPADPSFPWLAEITPTPQFLAAAEASAATVQKAVSMIKQFPAHAELSEEEFQAILDSRKLHEEDYTPGSTTRCIAGWHVLFNELDDMPLVAEVRRVLTEGYKIQFADPALPSQQQRPNNKEKRQVLYQLLTSVYGETEAEAMLTAQSIKPMKLPNFKSAAVYKDYVKEEVAELKLLGIVAKWEEEEPPHQVNPIGVVAKEGKKRLVVGPLNLNFFEKASPFHYETLQKAVDFLQPGDWCYKLDAKKGYFHIPLHPDSYKYFAFEADGELMYYRFLVFGLGSACNEYTIMMKVVNALTRKFAEQLMQYIDDRFGAARTRAEARFRSAATILLMDGLGIFSNKKSCIEPTQDIEMLGMQIVTNFEPPELPEQRFVQLKVPAKKLEKIQNNAKQLLGAEVCSRRNIAKLAGQIISNTLAMPLSRSYVQFFYEFLKTPASWDSLLPLDERTKNIIRWVMEMMPAVNGNAIKKPLRPEGVKIIVDTSDFLHGAELFDLYTGEKICSTTIPVPAALVGAASSSTLREALGIAETVKQAMFWMQQHNLMHRYLRVHCVNDNQGAVADFKNLKAGSLEILEQVHAVNSMALKLDVEFSIQWMPRTTPQIQRADALSRDFDIADFRLSSDVVNKVCAHSFPRQFVLVRNKGPDLIALFGRETWAPRAPGPRRNQRFTPTVDLLAASTNRVADRFFSRHYDAEAEAFDAMQQPWPVIKDGVRQLYFIFPGPVSDALISKVISKLREERCDAILILPKYSFFPWKADLQHLPILDSFQINHGIFTRRMYQPGPRTPENLRDHPPRRPLAAYFVSWKLEEKD